MSLPDREYELAGRLVADAIAEAARSSAPVIETLHRRAARHGRSIGEAARSTEHPPATAGAALDLAVRVLTEHGYEPHYDGELVVLANCPFHALAEAQTQLVCHMNHALICGVADALEPHRPQVLLEPHPSRCCVVLGPKDTT